MTKAPAVPSRTRPSGTDHLSYAQLAAARKAARHLLYAGVLAPAEHGIVTRVVQRISAALDARTVTSTVPTSAGRAGASASKARNWQPAPPTGRQDESETARTAWQCRASWRSSDNT